MLRKSGTEPLLRVMAEGENETQVRTMAEQIAVSIRAVTLECGIPRCNGTDGTENRRDIIVVKAVTE